jgi:hypothetical protein
MMIILLASCHRQEASDKLLSYFGDAPAAVLAPESSIDLEQYGILAPTWIARYQDSFILKKQKADNFVDIITPDGTVIPCVQMGRGRGEMILATSVQLQGDTLFVYGMSQKKLLALDVPGTIASQKQVVIDERQIGDAEQLVSDQMVMPVYMQCVNGHYYGVGMFGDGSLCAELSDEGKMVSGIPGAELEDAQITDMTRRVLNTAALMASSPDGNRIAVAYSQIACLAFADTQPGLTARWTKTFFQPSLWYPNEQGVVVSYGKENVSTFQGLQAFDDSVYALYSGKDRIAVDDTEEDVDHCRHLLVFDWDGNPLKKYELDVPVVSFCIDGEDLYGLAYYPETRIFRFALK